MPNRAVLNGFLLVGLMLVGCTEVRDPPSLAGQDVHLTIIHTSDTHSRVFPYKYSPTQIDKNLGLLPTHGTSTIVGGYSRLSTTVQSLRASASRSLHIDSGDIFQGAPVFNLYAGEVEMRGMTLMGLNAMVVGNHEFDRGVTNLFLEDKKFAGFPILAANYMFDDPNDPTKPKAEVILRPYQIFNVGGVKVGVFGMGDINSMTSIFEGGNSLGMRPLETSQVVKNMVNVLRSQVDLLIMGSHMGLDADENLAVSDVENDINASSAIEGVDLILGGHLHIVLNPPQRIEHADGTYTIICHSGAFAKYVGQLDLVVHIGDPNGETELDRKSRIASYTYNLIPITDQTNADGSYVIRNDPEMDNLLEPYQVNMSLRLNLGENFAVVPCAGDAATCPKVMRSDPNGGDSQLGNLVATAMRVRQRVEADFSLTNSLGIRTDFESGPIDLEEMYNVFPFENTITTMYLSGTEVQEMLDFLAQRGSERGCKTQAQVAGIWFVTDCTNKVSCGPFDANGNRASRCHASDRLLSPEDPERLDGPPLLGSDCLNNPANCRYVLPFASYRVAVNDYIAAGGSGFQVLKRNTTKFNTGISLRDALVDFIRTLPNRCDVAEYPDLVGPIDPDTELPTYDYTKLPCVIPEKVLPHDSRVQMVSP